jgi:hypothetical protein
MSDHYSRYFVPLSGTKPIKGPSVCQFQQIPDVPHRRYIVRAHIRGLNCTVYHSDDKPRIFYFQILLESWLIPGITLQIFYD